MQRAHLKLESIGTASERRRRDCRPRRGAGRRWRAVSCRFDLAFRHLPFATALASELAGHFETGAGAFDGEFPFHFGKAGHHVKKEAARGCAGVDRVGEALELHAQLVKFAHQVHQMLYAAAEPVELPDDQGVTLA